MRKFQIYDSYRESYFIKRKNRFTIAVRLKNNSIIDAYLPNTGRLEEHLIPGNILYLTRVKTPKFDFKAISTYYQDSFVFLDTVKLNSIFEKFVSEEIIKEIGKPILLCNEYSIGNHRLDFYIRDSSHNKNLIEIKSCTLCHNGTAMFPDAPSKRALSHISLLSSLFTKGYKPWIIFLISHSKAKRFIPNLHTDPDFTDTLLNPNIYLNILALKYEMLNPVTINLDSVEKVQIDSDIVKNNLTISGSYILILKNEKSRTIKVGKLGEIFFKKGYYVYVGSAMNNLEKRVKRHYKKIKNKRWHIDYVCPEYMKIQKSFKIRRKDRIEEKVAVKIMQISTNMIKGFGSSDTGLPSHLFYFDTPPQSKSQFIKIILDYQTFTENKS